MGKERRSFSPEFKRDAVAVIAASGQGLSQTARSLGIHPSLLQAWRSKFQANDKPAELNPTESLEEENRRLRRENTGLREDREILKKAAAFFAKESRSGTLSSRSRERSIRCVKCVFCSAFRRQAITSGAVVLRAHEKLRITFFKRTSFVFIVRAAGRMVAFAFAKNSSRLGSTSENAASGA